MTEPFNPFEHWLGIRHKNPNYYEILGLRELETDVERIRTAANRAITRVRSHRPGPHAAQWAELLDTLRRIQSELTDPAVKQAYDSRLRPAKAVAPAGATKHVVPARGDVATRDPMAPVTFEELPEFSANAAAAEQIFAEGISDISQGRADPMAPVDPASLAKAGEPVFSSPDADRAVADRGAVVAGRQGALAQALIVHSARSRKSKTILPLIIVGLVCLLTLLGVVGYVFRDSLGIWGGSDELVDSGSDENSFFNGTSGDSDALDASQSMSDLSNQQFTSGSTNDIAGATDDNSLSSQSAVAVHPDDENSIEGTADGQDSTESTLNDDSGVNTSSDDSDATDPSAHDDASLPATGQSESVQPTTMTAQERQQLSQALTGAREALQAQDFETAQQHINDARPLAKLPEYAAMVNRLAKAAGYLREYRTAIDRALQALGAGVSFEVNPELIVVIVERKPDALVIRVGGMNQGGRNQEYALNQLPLKLGLALVDQVVPESDRQRLIKGTYQALHSRATPDHLAEVRQWWNQAGKAGDEMLPLLDDDYDSIANEEE